MTAKPSNWDRFISTACPLDSALRQKLEAVFGEDLSNVRIGETTEASRIGARAFSAGNFVGLAPGTFQPECPQGLAILAHEIAHFLQQPRAGVEANPCRADNIYEDAALEAEADRAASAAMLGHPFRVRGKLPSEIATRGAAQLIKMSIGHCAYPQLLQILDNVAAKFMNQGIQPATRTLDFQKVDLSATGVKNADIGQDPSVSLKSINMNWIDWQRPGYENTARRYFPAIYNNYVRSLKATAEYNLTQGVHWLWLVGRLRSGGNSGRPDILNCWLYLSGGNSPVLASKAEAGGERIFFPGTGKTDLNYKEVSEGFIANIGTGNDSSVAQWMLDRVQGKANNAFTGAKQNWLDALTLLLFGVESSRFISGICTTTIFLDLIAQRKSYGRSGKLFGFDKAFHSDQWEDGQWYGGKFPYATHGTGSGNWLSRQALRDDNDMDLLEHFLNLPQRHSVPRREISLFVHWLEATFAPDIHGSLHPSEAELALETRMKAQFVDNAAAPLLRYSPSATSGLNLFGYSKSTHVKAPVPNDINTEVWIHQGMFSGKGLAMYFHANGSGTCGRNTGRTGFTDLLATEPLQNKRAPTFKKGKGYILRRKATGSAQGQASLDGAWTKVTLKDATTLGRTKCPSCWI